MSNTTRGECRDFDATLEPIPESWHDFLGEELREKMNNIVKLIQSSGEYFPRGNVFSAFNYCSPADVKVVIVGQDPYHGSGEANGLCFSVGPGVPVPPSLRNIFKELRSDLLLGGEAIDADLSRWARQGVLLLNTILTVKPNIAASHKDFGWQSCTHEILRRISGGDRQVVFILWGTYAKSLRQTLGPQAFIIDGAHPSPLSANRGGFFGGKYFSRANESLIANGLEPIDWY
jgi:uracil-DNA glycosylase